MNVLLRSLFLQCSWNLERMQNLGFLYSLMPALKKIYSREEDLRAAQARHLELFNSQPYMVTGILGAVVNLEKQCAEGKIAPDYISLFKKNTMSGFAALGDSFFWNTLRPLSAAIALVFAFKGRLWAPLALLAIYNTAHFFVRGRGYVVGRRKGVGLIDEFQKWRVPDRVKRLRILTPLVLALALFYSVSVAVDGVQWWAQLSMLPAVFLFRFFFVRNISPAAILLGVFALATLAALIMEV